MWGKGTAKSIPRPEGPREEAPAEIEQAEAVCPGREAVVLGTLSRCPSCKQ